MILFTSDYTEGAHPRIIEKLAETNMEQTVGYGEDPYCEEAREAIKKVCEAPEADVHFLVGGTQTNFTVISSILRPFQGVICADSGHINVHETGAVEATPDTKFWHFLQRKEKSQDSRSRNITTCTGVMSLVNILYSQRWFIFHIRQR